ncbi:Ku DNA-binding complex, Ku70 subunit [Fistulina hepatica ATCC 64428]|uniref:ATP-dependent DNA helicase II subunit 1 n=1 Tax=Fistulina hepatica ATCC 64428 TaxID=1128425 RepID=A0A0D7ASW9_9AGAR|nr:Ku DNA-binding complex, Ku70 subunit [Fistulina hepatica ATCC 64428]
MPFDDWNKIDEEEEELQDSSWLEGKRDVILFCIDCSPSMQKPYNDRNYEGDLQTSHLVAALDAAVQIQKKKIIVGPNDSVGILLFNTTRTYESAGDFADDRVRQGAEIKRNTYLFQPIGPMNADRIREVMYELDDPITRVDHLRETFPPLKGTKVPIGDVFTSCNWVMRDGAPKTATKRVFLITDDDAPHLGAGNIDARMRKQLVTSARTTLNDLAQSGVTVEPFFISTMEHEFNMSLYYKSVLRVSDDLDSAENEDYVDDARHNFAVNIEDLLAQMRFREVPKRALFSIPFELGAGFTIGIKGYGLVVEQKKGTYKYFLDNGQGFQVVESRTSYVDEDVEQAASRARIVYGTEVTGTDEEAGYGVRMAEVGKRPFFTAEEMRQLRTLGLEPGIKLLGFKDRDQLQFEDNIKHSHFIYPDELTYAGSKRTFSALLKSMVKKNKIGLVRVLTRRNASPVFCAMVPQEERHDADDWVEPPGFHLIQLPFADEIRSAKVTEGRTATKWMDKLTMKNKKFPRRATYIPDSYPNPALAYHNEQLQATAFQEEYNGEDFEDLTAPPLDMIHERAGAMMKAWKDRLSLNDAANEVIVTKSATTGTKRKTSENPDYDDTEIRSRYESGTLAKMRVDEMKEFLKAHALPVSGKKADLLDRVIDYLQTH